MMSRSFRALPVRPIAILCALIFCTILVSCDRGPKRALRMNLTPGVTYVLSIRTSGEIALESSDGKKMNFPSTTENNFVLRPDKIDEHGDMLVSVEAGKSVFPMLYSQLNTAFQGYTFGMKVSPVGRVTELIDTEAIRRNIGANVPGAASLLYGISDDVLRSIIEPVIAIWPAVPVTVGDEWTRPDIYTSASDAFESTTFRLKSWDESGAVLTFNSTFRPAGKNTKDFDIRTTGKGMGEIHIMPAEGTIRSFEANHELAGTVTNMKSGVVAKFSGTQRVQAELTAR